ncbi:alpha/beta fold hydrolase [Hyphomonas sp.]|uniref:alpha/beta fold hydrolase n=1 Tax=Hyphomonas sp. TaxID=87 RepID=UPI00391B2673
MYRRTRIKRANAAAAALLLGLITGCASLDGAATAPVAGLQASYALAGAGKPTVVFESGLGDGKGSFAEVFADLQADTSVFAYDRPGYGGAGSFAADADGARTGEEVAQHLHALLAAAGVKPPYLLAGHSIGGLYILSFAKLYPDEVAGLVLVDGRPAGFTAACEASRSGLCTPPDAMIALFPANQKAEFRGVAATEAFAARPEDLGDIPVTVISAGKAPAMVAGAFQPIWEAMQQDFADRARQGRYVLAERQQHYVHQENPRLVAAEIRRLLAQAAAPGT